MNKLHLLACLFFSLTSIFSQTSNSQSTDAGKPFVLGVINEIQSKELGEKRILNIYLPEGYNPNEATKYPVIYLLDGSADEDFIHISGLVQFNSFEWVNQVPKSIVVGIGTVDRRRDFTFPTTIEKDQKRFPTSGHSDKFIAFIEKELQPFIDKKYKTTNSKMIIGQSLGGLLETEILLKKPNLFNKYIIVSPSLWWNNGSLLNDDSIIFQQSFNQPIDIYIAVGKEGLTPTEIPRVMEVDANLLAERIKSSTNKNIKVNFEYFPEENHATILHPAVAHSFRVLYSKPQE
ncbi:alpha/beta hydrolase-fold protein [Flavobacterium aquidurense]|uniref:alpha/beta hydrolase n=1 Tax=Flavobacterium aquidurense TaxID=362413 RepID=UPI00285C0B37|nr:alpha/beta hydrolase-fold protein [Flavobacterium aquidurense]MDR7370983.1 putative alpha/beta superfamily hydrolase [Flavobacterium aquidurense]